MSSPVGIAVGQLAVMLSIDTGVGTTAGLAIGGSVGCVVTDAVKSAGAGVDDLSMVELSAVALTIGIICKAAEVTLVAELIGGTVLIAEVIAEVVIEQTVRLGACAAATPIAIA